MESTVSEERGVLLIVSRVLDRVKQLNYWLLAIPMIALVGMFFLDAANVLTIRVFGFRATPSQKELIEEQLVLVVYIGLTYVLLGPGHIKTDMVKNHLKPLMRFFADLVSDLAMLSLAVFTTVATSSGTIVSYRPAGRKPCRRCGTARSSSLTRRRLTSPARNRCTTCSTLPRSPPLPRWP
ncbi:MAG: hypothetical protein HYX96_04140 [Chloroflexi bacterium]|nr:hypothetical protein [Chloroflexota bacterium]